MNESKSNDNLIEIKSGSKVYYTKHVKTSALNDVCLKVNEGESIAIVGSSGSGKSTLLSAIGLIELFSSGEYRLKGSDVSKLKARELAKLRSDFFGYIFQSFLLIDTLTVHKNIALALKYKKLPGQEIDKRVKDVLHKVGMEHRANHYPGELSGGQQQRVAIARAIIAEPKVILADEPTGNLDSKNSKDILDLLTQLNIAGTTLLTVTHSENIAEKMSRRLVMSDGLLN